MTIHGDPSRVRLADARDEEELMLLSRALHEENGAFDMCEDKVRRMLKGALTPHIEERKGLIGVIGAPDAIEGAIWLDIDALWYTDQICLMELFNYVYPQFRSSNNSADLISFARRMADHFNLQLMIGVLSTHRTQAKVRLYRKQLGEPAGAFFKYSPSVSQRMN